MKKIVIIFILFFCVSQSFSQEIDFSKLVELYADKNYKPCLKKSEEIILINKNHPFAYFFKSMCLFNLRSEDYIKKDYSDPFIVSMESLLRAKRYDESKEAFIKYNKDIVKLQAFIIKSLENYVSKNNITQADKYFEYYFNLFDNSCKTFEMVNGKRVQELLFILGKNLYEQREERNGDKYFNLLIEKFDNSDSLRINNYSNEMQKIIFEKGKELYLNKKEDASDVYFSKLIKMFYNSKFQYIYKDSNDYYNENYVFSEWDYPKYRLANTGKNADYLSKDEKKVIYYLNLCRMNPKLFAKTYLAKYLQYKYPKDTINAADSNVTNNDSLCYKQDYFYVKTLYQTLDSIKPLNILVSDNNMFLLAKCWAVEAGKKGIKGHNRKECADSYDGECCSYGYDNGLDIIMSLLIDKGVPTLEHRELCLLSYKGIGVSIQPHKEYRVNAVLDFIY